MMPPMAMSVLSVTWMQRVLMPSMAPAIWVEIPKVAVSAMPKKCEAAES
jgi:hypothetical protein